MYCSTSCMALARLELMALDSAWTSSKLVRMVKQRHARYHMNKGLCCLCLARDPLVGIDPDPIDELCFEQINMLLFISGGVCSFHLAGDAS